MTGPIRDPRFYYPDGNAVILVEDTLFKVHRSILSQECSTFEAMFSMAGVNSPDEGHCDENPIHIQGDTAEEFRALMWSLYALPRELLVTTGLAERFCQCARIAHKYQFQSIESWALNSLALSCPWSPPPSLVMLTEVAVLCDHTALLNLTKRNLRTSIRNEIDCSLIINAAERLNLRDIKGLAYYAMMLRGRKVWEADPLLTRDHRIRLLSGFYALVHLEPAAPPPPPLPPHCLFCGIGNCRIPWENLWHKSLAGEIQLTSDRVKSQALWQRTDLLGKVWYAEQAIDELSIQWQSHPQRVLTSGMCRYSMNTLHCAIERLLEQVSEQFADHFVDVL